jgi:hypothetical protein
MAEDVNGFKSVLFDLVELKQLDGFNAGDLLAVDPQLFPKFMKHLSKTVKRDDTTKKLAFLTGLSAYTPEPINLFLRGESSTGKTYNVVESLKYFPKEDIWLLGGLSKTALVHSYGVLVDKNGDLILPSHKPDKEASEEEKEAWRNRLRDSYYLVDLTGKILVFLDAPNLDTFMALRPILSHDAHEISYRFTDKTSKGQLQTQHVVIRGWPSTVFCSTAEKYVQDLATRSLTTTPETVQDKIREANAVTGRKSASPWSFENDFDFMLLEGYIRFLKNQLENLKIVIPYGKEFALNFPCILPRSMRDFKHILSLIKVLAFFYFAQRPTLILKEKTDTGEVEQYYVIAVREDYEFVMEIWNEIRESTETSASKHVLTFFHEVAEEISKSKTEFLVQDLTDLWNSKFQDRKSSHTIRKWVDFLCDVGYLTKQPDPNDKRQNRLKIIKSQNFENYVQNDLSAFFTLDSLKAWLNEAKQLWTENGVFLRESGISNGNADPEVVYDKFFLSKNRKNVHTSLSDFQASLVESDMEIVEKQESTQIPDFSLDSILKLERLTSDFQDKCVSCGFFGHMDWQITLHDGSSGLLCVECGHKLANKIREGN